MNRLRTTGEIAAELGITRNGLIVYLSRHKELRPKATLPSGDYLWTAKEIERVRQARTKPRRIRL